MLKSDSNKTKKSEAAVKAAAHSRSEVTSKSLMLASKNGFNYVAWSLYHNIDAAFNLEQAIENEESIGVVTNYLFLDIEFARHLFHEFSFCDKCGTFREVSEGRMNERKMTMILKTPCCNSGWKVIWWPEMFQGLVMAEDRFKYIGDYLQTRGLLQEAE